MLKKLICNKNKTLIEAWKLINENAKGTIFIIDDDNRLCGILTDGDIRRFLLKGEKLEEDIEKIMNTNFIYAYEIEPYKEMLKKLNSKIRILPIVNCDFIVIDYLEYYTNFHIPMALPNLNGNEFNYLIDAFLSTWISSSGEYIKRFEKEFSYYCGCKYGITVCNGTVALHLALVTLGIGNGDEVIVPDLTFAATINAVLHAHATPVIVDIEKNSWCIDPTEIEKAITPKTRAIIPVHLYGQPCNMDLIMGIAQKYKLYIIEDCAEAHGAEYNGKKVGSFGDIGCFSFFANKVITTGEGGMCVTNRLALDKRMRVLRDHGMSKNKKYWHNVVGYNYRMTNLQAAIGLAQIERLDEILKEREIIEENYKYILSDVKNFSFQADNLTKRKKITWLVCGLVGYHRDKLLNKLKESGIDARPFFYPLSKMNIYKNYVFSNENCLEISNNGVIFPTINTIDQKILNKIKNIFDHLT